MAKKNGSGLKSKHPRLVHPYHRWFPLIWWFHHIFIPRAPERLRTKILIFMNFPWTFHELSSTIHYFSHSIHIPYHIPYHVLGISRDGPAWDLLRINCGSFNKVMFGNFGWSPWLANHDFAEGCSSTHTTCSTMSLFSTIHYLSIYVSSTI